MPQARPTTTLILILFHIVTRIMSITRSLAVLSAFAGLLLLACMPRMVGDGSPTPTVRRPTPVAPAPSASTPLPAPVALPTLPGSHRFAVVCENAEAAAIGMAMLESGGSAADAAMAATLAAGVTEPATTGLGGGGFALHWDQATGKATALDFREAAPIGIKADDHEVRPPRESTRGVNVGVPGMVAGLDKLHAAFGKRPRADIYEAAAKLAADGFAVSAHAHRTLRWHQRWLLKSPLASVLAPTGALSSRGDRAQNPALAATLREIGKGGPTAFYGGDIGTAIVEAARAAGARIVAEDLTAYSARERTPLQTRWEGADIYSLPPPSAGGLMLIQTLRMHDMASLAKLGYQSGAYLHVLAETFRGSIADRMLALGDPDYIRMDLNALMSKTRLRARLGRISVDKTRGADAFSLDDRGTSNVIAVDAAGNVAIVTTSLNDMFGARIVTGGFPLNDSLLAFSDDRSEQRFGAARRPNAPRGGARPVSSMTPALVVKDGRVVGAFGASGGTRMPTAVTQGLLAHLVFGKTARDISADIRVDAPPMGGLDIDQSAAPELIADLKARGEVVVQRPNYSALGVVTISDRDGKRLIEAAVDPRKGGAALVK